jgi:hypothetical protein
VRQAEQWMKVSSQSFSVEYPVRQAEQWRGPGRSPTCFKGTTT